MAGGGGGGLKWGSGKTKIDSASTLTPAQQLLSSGLIGYTAENLFGNGKTTHGTLAEPNVYRGDRVASESELQNAALTTAHRQGLASTQNLLSGAWMNPITAQAQNLWQNTIMPDVMNRQSGMDAANTGGTTQALMKGGQDLSTQLAGQLAPLSLQASAQGMSNLGNIYQLGALQQQQGQNELDALQQRGKEQQVYNNPMLQYALKLLPQSGEAKENVVYQNPATSKDIFGQIFDIF